MILQSDKVRVVINEFKQEVIDEGMAIKISENKDGLIFLFPADFNERPLVNRLVVINAFNKMARIFVDWDIKFTIGATK